MAHVEQVGAASSSSPLVAVGLIAPATAARVGAVVGVPLVGGGATGLGVVGRRPSLIGCHW